MLQAKCFNWAFFNAGATVDTGVFVYLCFVSYFYCFNWTSWFTGGTAGAGCFIHFYCHNVLPRRTPDTGIPIYLLPLRAMKKIYLWSISDRRKFHLDTFFIYIFETLVLLFWFICFHLLVRSSSTKGKIQINKSKFKPKKYKEIQKSNQDCFWFKPIGKYNRPKEWDKHPN